MATDPRELYLQGVRNLHAEKTQAIQTFQRQVERLENYPQLEQRMRQHIQESEQARSQLEAILGTHSSSPSSLKETVTGLVGNLTGAVHAAMSDEVLKNTFANYGLEHHEIAATMSLIAMAEAAGDTQHVAQYKQMMAADSAMADFIKDQIVPTTQRYIQLESQGAQSKT